VEVLEAVVQLGLLPMVVLAVLAVAVAGPVVQQAMGHPVKAITVALVVTTMLRVRAEVLVVGLEVLAMLEPA
jgi:hypothetical protein